MTIKNTLLIFSYVVCVMALNAQTSVSLNWNLDLELAKQEAQDSNKKILLVFSGSDWCGPCIKLDKNIWQTQAFQTYAYDNLVLVKADFPRKKSSRLSEEQQDKNNALAERYNPNGYFPLVILMDAKGNQLGQTGYKDMSPEQYVNHLNSINKP